MSAEVILCCGVGGVGKTTTAAAVAVGHALAGHRVVALTIDPAKRLADALGVDLGNDPTPVRLDEIGYAGPGRLDALMLDRKATFDDAIRRFAPDPAVAQRLLANRYYRAVSERLGGSHEYMAMEKLYDLVADGRWDVVVVDTPPTQHALDFFRAPDRIRRVLDRSVLGALINPGRGLIAATTRRVAKVVTGMTGEGVMEDIGEFFQLLSGMSARFRDQGEAVHKLMRSDATRCYLVASAEAPDRTDALAFLATLRDEKMRFAGFLVNRVFPDPAVPDVSAADLPDHPPDVDPESWKTAIDAFLAHLDDTRATVREQRRAIEALKAHAPDAPIWEVPDLGDSVRTLEGLAALAAHLPPNTYSKSER